MKIMRQSLEMMKLIKINNNQKPVNNKKNKVSRKQMKNRIKMGFIFRRLRKKRFLLYFQMLLQRSS